MPLIQARPRQTKVSTKIALDNETQSKLRAYCRFSRAVTDEVVSGALNLLFRQDPEFGPWYETHKSDGFGRRLHSPAGAAHKEFSTTGKK